MKRKKKEVVFYIVTILSCLIAMTVVVIAALLIYDRVKAKAEAEKEQEVMADLPVTYSQEEVDLMLREAVSNAQDQTRREVEESILSAIEQGLTEGNTVVETLRPLYPDDIVVVSNGAFHFVPIREDLKKHGRLKENLQVLENGEFQYFQDGQVVSHKGIDVSKYQGNIDWQQVAADGVEFAIIRVGIRGYGEEGRIVADEMFARNVQGAKEAGIKVGVYFFAQAITEEEAIEEANFVLEQIAPYEIDYPVVYDVEKVSAKNGRMNQLSVIDRTNVTLAFMNRIKEAGYTPMLYGNMEMLALMIDLESFEEFDKWFAYYGESLYYPYDYSVWQYTEKGIVSGIEGEVDLNISFKEW